EFPPGVFPFPPDDDETELAERQVKMMMAGVIGSPEGPPPSKDPEIQRLYFDLISRVADPAAANGSPFVVQWRFTDADPWHLVLDNGSTRAEAGEAPNANVTIETSWNDWIAAGKPDANQLKMVLQRRLRPRGKVRDLRRFSKVFN
ncbi:MAG TPA: SCP2 sterol-binding domain-containing protein, partial [Solirubrobacterales bacterium]|nr:SCP2 sterol-binding domain-containing protein [Solirubrobacterales bacterium]